MARPTWADGTSRRTSIPGLQQDALGLHQPLAHRPVGGLAEVAPLGVLGMGPARHQGDLHIRERGAGQDPQVDPLSQMGQHQALPAALEHILAARGGKAACRSPGARVPAADGPRHSGAGAQNAPPPPPGRQWSLCRGCSPCSKATESPNRSAMTARRISS